MDIGGRIARGVKFIMNDIIKQRFPPEAVATLNERAWWDWRMEKITKHLEQIVSGDIDAVQRCAANAW